MLPIGDGAVGPSMPKNQVYLQCPNRGRQVAPKMARGNRCGHYANIDIAGGPRWTAHAVREDP